MPPTWVLSLRFCSLRGARALGLASLTLPPVPPAAFYTSRYGYKMCLRIYLNGDGTGRGTHLSLFFVVMKGPNDALLRWPFNQKVREAVPAAALGDPGGRQAVRMGPQAPGPRASRGSVAAVEPGRHPLGPGASGHLGPAVPDAASGLVSEEGPRLETVPEALVSQLGEGSEVPVPSSFPFAVPGQPRGLPGGGSASEKCCSSGRAAGIL